MTRVASGRGAARPSSPPKAVLLVDRAELLGIVEGIDGLAAVSLDGAPPALVKRLARSFRDGLRVPVLYLHDASTVVYPFSVEPLASLVARADSAPIVYRDLGLPPLGASARRFGDASLPSDTPITELASIPPATLARYVARATASALAGQPSA